MRPKLTEEQRTALAHSAGKPVEVEDDQSHAVFLLVSREDFHQHEQEMHVDEDKLKAAILGRRDESRALNAEWEHVDREVWENGSPSDV